MLFDGVFGASDEILGAVGNGVDLERRIADIYKTCRTEAEIHAEFNQLQDSLRPLIEHKLAETREQILSHFDAEVQERLRVHREEAKAALNKRQRWLWDLLRYELNDSATFAKPEAMLTYHGTDAPAGRYHLDWRAAELGKLFFLGPDHRLAQTAIETAATRPLASGCLTFCLSNEAAFARLWPFAAQSGQLAVERLTVGVGAPEQFLLTIAAADSGQILPLKLTDLLWQLPAKLEKGDVVQMLSPELRVALDQRERDHEHQVQQRRAEMLDQEAEKLTRWADDEKLALKLDMERMDQTIKEVQRQVRLVHTLDEKLKLRREERDLDRLRSEKRRALFDAQDRVDAERNRLLEELEAAMESKTLRERLWLGRWRIELG